MRGKELAKDLRRIQKVYRRCSPSLILSQKDESKPHFQHNHLKVVINSFVEAIGSAGEPVLLLLHNDDDDDEARHLYYKFGVINYRKDSSKYYKWMI